MNTFKAGRPTVSKKKASAYDQCLPSAFRKKKMYGSFGEAQVCGPGLAERYALGSPIILRFC